MNTYIPYRIKKQIPYWYESDIQMLETPSQMCETSTRVTRICLLAHLISVFTHVCNVLQSTVSLVEYPACYAVQGGPRGASGAWDLLPSYSKIYGSPYTYLRLYRGPPRSASTTRSSDYPAWLGTCAHARFP
jgi:hypothetical protein